MIRFWRRGAPSSPWRCRPRSRSSTSSMRRSGFHRALLAGSISDTAPCNGSCNESLSMGAAHSHCGGQKCEPRWTQRPLTRLLPGLLSRATEVRVLPGAQSYLVMPMMEDLLSLTHESRGPLLEDLFDDRRPQASRRRSTRPYCGRRATSRNRSWDESNLGPALAGRRSPAHDGLAAGGDPSLAVTAERESPSR